jgi:hypothetical protein
MLRSRKKQDGSWTSYAVLKDGPTVGRTCLPGLELLTGYDPEDIDDFWVDRTPIIAWRLPDGLSSLRALPNGKGEDQRKRHSRKAKV